MCIIAIILVSCQPVAETEIEVIQTYTIEPTISSDEIILPTDTAQPEEKAINPLTGLEVNDPQILKRRPVMVKVSNYPRNGRPHAGLSFTDIVFEYYIGEGSNRFLALFYSQDCSKIGPVRSGRLVDAQLVLMYSGILAYGSADKDTDAEITKTLGAYAINNFEAPEPAFTGVDTHSEEDINRIYANSAAISQFVTEQGLSNGTPDLPGMVFSDEIPNHGKYADQVSVYFNHYNRGDWRYDPSSGKYLRWIEYMEDETKETYEMIPLVDRVTGNQLAFSNVVIIFAEYTELAPSKHEIDIWGNDKGKPAYFFRDGMVFKGTWRAKNDTDPMQFFNDSGEPMPLKPGNTWIVIAHLNSTFKEIASRQWEMFFIFP